MTMHETFPSSSGQLLDLHIWEPATTPIGIIQLVHGMAEHIARYEEPAQAFANAGYVVVGHTQLGHGEKAQTPGHFAKHDGWQVLLNDIDAVRTIFSKRYPNLPYFLLGHSMGSFLVRSYCLTKEQGLAGVILSGTGHFPPALVYSALSIANIQCALGMEEKPSKLLDNLSFTSNNKAFKPSRTSLDWLSRDNEHVDKYIADPYCGFPFTAGGFRDLFTGLRMLFPKNLTSMDKTVPVLLFSGADDPVGSNFKGVERVAYEMRKAGVQNITLKAYPQGRHEMFNELNREEVYADVILWINSIKGRVS